MVNPPERPDPIRHIRRLKEIFTDAAAKSKGPNQPRFQKVSDTFDAYAEAALRGDDAAPARRAFEDATLDLRVRLMRGDPDYQVYVTMNNDVMRENMQFNDSVRAYDGYKAAEEARRAREAAAEKAAAEKAAANQNKPPQTGEGPSLNTPPKRPPGRHHHI